MSACDEFVLLLSARLDGELTEAEEARLQAHLEVCPRCRALWEELSSLSAALKDLPELEPPAGLHDSILTALQAEDTLSSAPSAPEPARSRSARRHGRSLAALAAMAAVVVMAVSAAGRFPAAGGSSGSALLESGGSAVYESTAPQSDVISPTAKSAPPEALCGIPSEPVSGNAAPPEAAPSLCENPADGALRTEDGSAALGSGALRAAQHLLTLPGR